MKNLAYNEEEQEVIRGINSPMNARLLQLRRITPCPA